MSDHRAALLAALTASWRDADRLAESPWSQPGDARRREAYEQTIRAVWRTILRGTR